MSRLINVLAGALLMAAPASAQFTTTMTGKVEAAPASPCNATATHRIACTDILLKSSTLDLAPYLNRVALLTGNVQIRLFPYCVTLDVTAVENATNRTTAISLSNYRINSNVIVSTFAPIGAAVPMLFAAGPGFVPLGAWGTLMLDPATMFYWATDVSVGLTLRSIPIPNDPSLVNVQIIFQTGYATVTPAVEFGLLNPICFTIRS